MIGATTSILVVLRYVVCRSYDYVVIELVY
jgi:hypothetical protein